MNKYTNGDKILHRLFLGDTPLSNFLYKRLLNKSKYKKKLQIKNIFS